MRGGEVSKVGEMGEESEVKLGEIGVVGRVRGGKLMEVRGSNVRGNKRSEGKCGEGGAG